MQLKYQSFHIQILNVINTKGKMTQNVPKKKQKNSNVLWTKNNIHLSKQFSFF